MPNLAGTPHPVRRRTPRHNGSPLLRLKLRTSKRGARKKPTDEEERVLYELATKAIEKKHRFHIQAAVRAGRWRKVAKIIKNNTKEGRLTLDLNDKRFFGAAGYSLLMDALSCQKPMAAMATSRLLLENGSDPNLAREVGDGETPLLMAIRLKKVQLVELLLEFGARTDTVSPDWGATPLQHAIWYGDMEVVKLLLRPFTEQQPTPCLREMRSDMVALFNEVTAGICWPRPSMAGLAVFGLQAIQGKSYSVGLLRLEEIPDQIWHLIASMAADPLLLTQKNNQGKNALDMAREQKLHYLLCLLNTFWVDRDGME